MAGKEEHMIIQAMIWMIILSICGAIVYFGYKQWKKTEIKEKEEAVNEKLSHLDKEAELASKISVFNNEDSKENEAQINAFLNEKDN